jgi:hypothetical protein
VARTIADLDAAPVVVSSHIAEAIQYMKFVVMVGWVKTDFRFWLIFDFRCFTAAKLRIRSRWLGKKKSINKSKKRFREISFIFKC